MRAHSPTSHSQVRTAGERSLEGVSMAVMEIHSSSSRASVDIRCGERALLLFCTSTVLIYRVVLITLFGTVVYNSLGLRPYI